MKHAHTHAHAHTRTRTHAHTHKRTHAETSLRVLQLVETGRLALDDSIVDRADAFVRRISRHTPSSACRGNVGIEGEGGGGGGSGSVAGTGGGSETNGTDLVTLFGPMIRNVTLRYLLQMQSGLQEYDNSIVRTFQNTPPNRTSDLGPLWIMVRR